MALTVTSRGTGTHNTGATTLVPGGRTATLAAGSMGVFCIAVDNAGSGGATVCAPASWTDAKGNVWTRRINALYDNGAASAGIEMAFYTAPITVALLTTDLGTITWAGGVSPVAKAWTWYEVIPSGGNTVDYSTGGNIAGATAANAQVVTASVLVGDAVIAGYFSENVNAVTGDSDTTNGTWTAQQTTTIGTGVAGVRIATQQKVQTTTASTQSYDVTVVSQDRIAGYIMLHEIVALVVTPDVLATTTATFEPTVSASNHQTVTPTTASLTSANFEPTVTATQHQLVVPTTADLVTTGLSPTVTATDHQTATPTTLGLALTAFEPTVTASDHQTVTPDTTALTLTAFTPTVDATAHVSVTPDLVALVTASFEPTINVTEHVTVTPDSAALVTGSFAPTVSAPVLVIPDLVSLTLTTFAPTLGGLNVEPPTALLVLAAFTPDVLLTDHQLVTPAAANLALTTFIATVTGDGPVVIPGIFRRPKPAGSIAPSDQASLISWEHSPGTIARLPQPSGTIED